MGYRLEISEAKEVFYGTKLYGYADVEKLKSIRYLISKEKLTEDKAEYGFIYGSDMPIVLSKQEFVEWAKLYSEDYDKYCPYKCANDDDEYSFIEDEQIKKIIEGNADWIVLSWS